jgi:hypothetical protein
LMTKDEDDFGQMGGNSVANHVSQERLAKEVQELFGSPEAGRTASCQNDAADKGTRLHQVNLTT